LISLRLRCTMSPPSLRKRSTRIPWFGGDILSMPKGCTETRDPGTYSTLEIYQDLLLPCAGSLLGPVFIGSKASFTPSFPSPKNNPLHRGAGKEMLMSQQYLGFHYLCTAPFRPDLVGSKYVVGPARFVAQIGGIAYPVESS
jgi:hypothetical protein